MSFWGETTKLLIGIAFAAPVVSSIVCACLVWRHRKTANGDEIARTVVTAVIVAIVVAMLCLASAVWLLKNRIPVAHAAAQTSLALSCYEPRLFVYVKHQTLMARAGFGARSLCGIPAVAVELRTNQNLVLAK